MSKTLTLSLAIDKGPQKINCTCGFIPVRGAVAASLSSFILLSSSLDDISAAISIHHSCGLAVVVIQEAVVLGVDDRRVTLGRNTFSQSTFQVFRKILSLWS